MFWVFCFGIILVLWKLIELFLPNIDCPWYSWNIAESGIKHNKSNQIMIKDSYFPLVHSHNTFEYKFCTSTSKLSKRNAVFIVKATGKLYHLWLRVECTLYCKLQSRARNHAVLVIGLYELLDPATELIEPPGPLRVTYVGGNYMDIW
jgi:hypothetical protein